MGLKLINKDKTQLVLNNEIKANETVQILTYFNKLLKSITKYQILQSLIYQKKLKSQHTQLFTKQYENLETQILSKNKVKKIDFLLNKKASKWVKLVQIYNKEILEEFLPNTSILSNLYKSEIEAKCLNLWVQKILQYDRIIENYQEKTQT